jgi:hypothetical protein
MRRIHGEGKNLADVSGAPSEKWQSRWQTLFFSTKNRGIFHCSLPESPTIHDAVNIRSPKSFSIFFGTMLAITTFAPTGHAQDERDFAGTVLVPDGLDASDVRDAIAITLASREWQVEAKESDHVVGYIKHRTREVTLTLAFDTKQIFLYSDGKVVNAMSEKIRRDPAKGWVDNIIKDLKKMLEVARAAK